MTRCCDVKASFPPSGPATHRDERGWPRRSDSRVVLGNGNRVPPMNADDYVRACAKCILCFLAERANQTGGRGGGRRPGRGGGSAASGTFAESDRVPVPTNCILCCFFFSPRDSWSPTHRRRYLNSLHYDFLKT